jgi:broad specificity phosphatase PhoE
MKVFRVIFLLALVAAIGLNACTTDYYIVRHAEKQLNVPDTYTPNGSAPYGPALTAAGDARAIVLRDTLRDKKIRHVFVSQFLRTQLTAEPTRAFWSSTRHEYNADDPAETLASQLRGFRGENVLVVGHSNTVPALIRTLCGVDVGAIADNDYDNLFVVRHRRELFSERFWLVRRGTYGAPSP